MDLGMDGWSLARGFGRPQNLPRRPPKPCPLGQEINVGLNMFPVINMPTRKVYQYDVQVGSGAEKRPVVRAVWTSKAVKNMLGPGWVFDGNRIAWALNNNKSEYRVTVDLDKERGFVPKQEKNIGRNTFKTFIRLTNEVKFDALNGYLKKQADFDNKCLEAVNFLEHLMQEEPSRKFIQIKKSFFEPTPEHRADLSCGVEAAKGVFSSLKIVHSGGGPIPARLAVNVDVANGTFWRVCPLVDLVTAQMRCRDRYELGALFVSERGKKWRQTRMYHECKRLRKIRVDYYHRGISGPQPLVVKEIVDKTPEQHDFTYVRRHEDTNEILETKQVNVQHYFRWRYQIGIQSNLPLVEVTKKGVMVPMEMLHMQKNQRFPYKLNETQTSAMIKFAVTPPSQRWAAIQNGVKMLNWQGDAHLKNFGLGISPQNAVVKARLLPPPDIKFHSTSQKVLGGKAQSGRWSIQNTKFLEPNTEPLDSWGFAVIQDRQSVNSDQTAAFMNKFISIYRAHGGRVTNARPAVFPISLTRGGEMIKDAMQQTTKGCHGKRPQIIFFILPWKNADLYNRIKKSCECRFGIMSQCLQAAHVQRCQDQYISNVCLKVNTKMGGATCVAVGKYGQITTRKTPGDVMIMGADVSHGAPGSEQGSMAALTFSFDHAFTRYAAVVQTNGVRTEIIATENMYLARDYIYKWMTDINKGRMPERLIYIRDGVAESQYGAVLGSEIRDLKDVLRGIGDASNVKLVVLIASKRHHIRFFPQGNAGDRNGNPKPGTLVETACTSPFEFDWYQCAHSAIKGTARPVHYYCLLNEANMPAEEIQQMVFEHSFQYCRATTPVSLHPAIYYAHLASNRAKSHENKSTISSGKENKPAKIGPDGKPIMDEHGKKVVDDSSSMSGMPAPLLQMYHEKGYRKLDWAMWYV
ncbi:Piwi domain-containing protein [Lineolata rhizophorae]|uniref:Piwi domain-containing protein n=1 Tax=Lineolata rhizophorae TaxID=578093 RepID=A0A6A6P6Y9_9PEZI|nr:Piwi domain-containing protein [Lineolata rhizophorae]